MLDLIFITLSSLLSGLRGQAALQAENIALRHQVTVLNEPRQATSPQTRRPLSVGLVVAAVVGMAFCPDHRHAGNRHRLASSRISFVLDLEDSTRKGRTTSSSQTNPRFDSNHEPREPDLGR